MMDLFAFKTRFLSQEIWERKLQEMVQEKACFTV